MSGAQWPARCEVEVDGVLDRRWSEWFEGLHMHNQGDQTTLSGTLRDRSELHGVLDKVRDLGLSVITVRRTPPGTGQGSSDETHPHSTIEGQARTPLARCSSS